MFFLAVYISQSEVYWVPLFVMCLLSEPVRHTLTGYTRHILLTTNHRAARSKNTIFLKNQMVVFFSANHASQSPPSWGLDVPLAMALCKTFLLRMLNGS
jgi:hypothetical protein